MKNKLQTYIDGLKNHAKTNKLLAWSKNTSLPGFKGVPLYYIGHFLYLEFKNEDLGSKANSMAYSFFISMFPIMLVLFSLIPFLPIENTNEVMLKLLDGIIPSTTKSLFQSIINDIAFYPRGGLLSVGFILAIYFSSNGMLELMNSFNREYGITFMVRNAFLQRLIAIQLTIILGLLVILAMSFLLLGNYVLSLIFTYIDANLITRITLHVFKWFVVIALFYSLISAIYYYGPALKKKIGFINLGSIVATVLSLITSIGFSIFVNNFSNYNKLYGSIGALIAIMVLFRLNSFIILIGFELNASIAVNKDKNRTIHQKKIESPTKPHK